MELHWKGLWILILSWALLPLKGGVVPRSCLQFLHHKSICVWSPHRSGKCRPDSRQVSILYVIVLWSGIMSKPFLTVNGTVLFFTPCVLVCAKTKLLSKFVELNMCCCKSHVSLRWICTQREYESLSLIGEFSIRLWRTEVKHIVWEAHNFSVKVVWWNPVMLFTNIVRNNNVISSN